MRGIEQLNDILDLIRNPEKYDAKAKQLQALVNEYKALVEAHVKVSQVDAFVQEAQRKNTEADKHLADAKVKADALLARTQEVTDQFKSEAEKTRYQANEMHTKSQQMLKEAEEKLKAAAAKLVMAEEKESAAAKSKEAADVLMEELKEKRAKLLQVMS